MITEKDLCLFNSVFSNKWNFLIISSLLSEEKKFSIIKRDLIEISDRVLSEKLKELVKYGIVEKDILIISGNISIKYRLTQKGKELKPIFLKIDQWMTKNF